MTAFALGIGVFAGRVGAGLLSGLTIAAVAIVAQAVAGMARTLTPDRTRGLIAVAAAAAALLVAGSLGQLAAIGVGVLAGLLWCRGGDATAWSAPRFPVTRTAGILSLGVAGVLLAGLPLLSRITDDGALASADVFFRAGALVFGGGHVVLPLLQAALVEPGWIGSDAFLAGYSAAQAVPGPLFTFAAYLGFASELGPGGIAGAGIALVSIFLPGFLLLVGVLPFWNRLRRHRGVQAALRGANAAVVGILAAALYQPVFTTAITGPASFVLALACFVLLTSLRAPAWLVVIAAAIGGLAISAGGA